MGNDMVNNSVNEISNLNIEVSKKQSNVKKDKNNDDSFSDILKFLKAEKEEINKSLKTTDYRDKSNLQDNNKKFEVVIKDNKQVSNKNTKSKEVKEVEVEGLEEEISDFSTEQIIQCLSAIIDSIQEITNEANLNIDVSAIDNLNLEIKEVVINADSIPKENTNLNLFSNVKEINRDDAISVVNNFLEMLNANNVEEFLDKDSISLANSLVETLSANLNEETNLENDNSFIKSLVSEVKTEINKILSNNNLQEESTNKIQQEELLLNTDIKEANVMKNNRANNDTVKESNSDNKNELKYLEKNIESSNLNKENNSESSDSKNTGSSFSKDEKILNSILKGSNSNNNLFAMPVNTTIVQNDGNIAVTEVQVINKNSMVADVIQTVKYMTNNNMKEMIVKINPNNLGEVTIKLIEENGIMKMNIKASSKETYSLLSQQVNEMKNQLNDQNIKIQEVNISLYEEDTTFFKDGGFNNNSSHENRRKGNSNIKENDQFNDEQEIDINDINSSAINMLA